MGAVLFAAGAAVLAQAAAIGGGTASDRNLAPHIALPTDNDRLITLEGATILVSDGPWTAQAIYEKLRENGLDSTIGAYLTVRVQVAYPPTRVTAKTERDRASGELLRVETLWLDAWPGSDFSRMPDRMIAHEIGLLWVAHHVEDARRDFWKKYLRIRGLIGDRRLDTMFAWGRHEILADDYRLLFGSPAAIEQYPRHMNRAIGDPRAIQGLRELLIEFAAGPS
jgi:hypothetical protein